jgi:hypothetical protein
MFFYDGTNFIAISTAITSNAIPGLVTPTGYLEYPVNTGSPILNVGHQIDFTISGGTSVITTGQYSAGQLGLTGTCNISGWSLQKLAGTADGSITIEFDGVTNSAPPSAPTIPNTTTNKLSASAPMTISTASSNAGGSSAVSTWTKTIGSWWNFAVNVSSVTSMTGVAGTVWCDNQ